MAATNNFQEVVFREILDFFKPITETNGDPDAILQLLEDCGWDMKALLGGNDANFFDKIGIVVQSLDRVKDTAENPPESIQDLIGALANLAPLFGAVHDIATSSVISNISQAPRIAELPEDIVNFLLAKYLFLKSPLLYSFLELAGILSNKGGDPVTLNGSVIYIPSKAKHFYFDRLGDLLSDPEAYFKTLYWPDGLPDLATANKVAASIFPKIAQLLGSLNITTQIGRGIGPNLLPAAEEDRMRGMMTIIFPYYDEAAGLSGVIKLSIGLLPANEGGPGIYAVPSGSLSLSIPFEQWRLQIGASAEIDGLSITKTDFDIYRGAGSEPQFTADLGLERISTETAKAFLIGSENATRFEIGKIAFGAGVSVNSVQKEFRIFGHLEDCLIVIAPSEGDSFLSTILGEDGIKIDFDLLVNWSNLAGFHIEGSGGLEIQLPTHISLGPIEIQNAIIALRFDGATLPLELGATIQASLGPIQAVVENMGLRLTTSFPAGGGNIGPANLEAGFKPPSGLGLSINAGAVIGGGYLFFDFDKEEYAGVLELTIAGFISAKAIGLITTKMPDGSKGFSMLIIITAEFNPPFQLGYGFTLIGVGGLLGLNRTVLLEPLRDGVRTGAVNNIMFPTNVVANAPRIISDLKTIFPVYEGKFLIGPMAKIGWGTPTLISLSLGLIIEIPGNFAILGVLRVILPDEEVPVVKIQVAFVGTIDFDKKMLTFDASLYESSILQTMTLEGDMALRVAWGEQANFLLTVGGFHPSFTPPPLGLPTLRRLAINILNTNIARIRVECYQAVTSNTVQFGAKAEVRFDLSVCKIEGFIAFDALFQFNPFFFIIELSAGFKLEVVGIDLLTVRVRMSLEGPTPWRAKGSGSVSLLFFDVSADFDKTWGDTRVTTIPDIEILPKFLETIQKKEQWSTRLSTGKNLLVSLRKLDEATEDLLVLHPAGSLLVQQKLLPLHITLDKIGNQKTADVREVFIQSASSNGTSLNLKEVRDSFALAQYQQMSDAEKLSRPSFEQLPGGVEVSMGSNSIKNGRMVRRKIEYELTIIDKQPLRVLPFGKFFKEMGVLFFHFVNGNSAAKSKLSKATLVKKQPPKQKLDLTEEGYTVAFTGNNKAFNAQSTFSTEAEAQRYMQEQLTANPKLKKQIHIVPQFELQTS